MEQEDWEMFIDTMKANVRSHADYFSWLSDRDVEELSVVQSLNESLAHHGQPFFHSLQSRGRGNDPPDCEARSCTGRRVGIEVTELVERKSMEEASSRRPIPRERWEERCKPFPESQLFDLLAERIANKDKSLVKSRGGPYDEYVLIIYCDEPRVLDYGLIEYVRGTTFPRTTLIDRAFLLFSFSPWENRCPYIELKIAG